MTKCLQSDTTLCVFSPECVSVKGQKKVFEGWFHTREIRESGGVFNKVQRALPLRTTQTHIRMAEVDDTIHAAVPSWYGGLEREITYRRPNYIHEMSCVEVGSHLYSRMCCAGRSERSAAVSISVTGGGSGWEGLMVMMLFFSMPPPTTQQALRVKIVVVQEVSEQSFIIIIL